ncbi:MAG: phosphate acyltransferase PlsX [Bacteroidia bacterium]|nr:phosphate acyltransferase PlsX [Bacteroidia bacterium]
MKIALDAMGGDFAPDATVKGALLASSELRENTIVLLIGQTEAIEVALDGQALPDNVRIVHASEIIGMSESPMRAFSEKKNSSIAVGYHLLKNREADAFCSAGNTGAMLVGAVYTVKITQVSRPAIMSYVPKLTGGYSIMLDVGANTDCKAETLHQFGELGSTFYQYLYDVDKPRVALINLGEEEEKGDISAQAAYKLMKENPRLHFVGNVEGRELFNDKADVLVCDGFVGNVIIKMAESYYQILKHKNLSDPFFDNFNYESIGGSPVLGVDGNVIISHGVSNAITIKNTLLLAQKMADANIHEKIKNALSQ